MYSNAYIWAKVIAYLDERMTPGIVSTFFDQSYILERNEQKMTVYAPSEFCKDFIERRCLGYIRDAVRELIGMEARKAASRPRNRELMMKKKAISSVPTVASMTTMVMNMSAMFMFPFIRKLIALDSMIYRITPR